MGDAFDSNAIDVPFSVAQVHRLRFTQNVFGDDEQVLAEVLERSDESPVRVQFWIDENLAATRPDLTQRIRAFSNRHAQHITQVGNVQIVPGGEQVKNDIHILERMLKVIHAAGLDRRSYVVVIGGGAVLDAVGFAAAIAHRGIRLVRLPTTTLAQADSGIGVKNAVNLFNTKNWIGAFAVPWAVINDAALLETLSDRDFLCGFSEAVKVSLLKDKTFFDRLCEWAERIRQRDMDVALPVIRESARWHLEHITRGGDPFEMCQARPLDFGHWCAHKMEPLSDFQLRHGEAVAIGLAIDTVYSSRMHGLLAADADRVLGCLVDMGFSFNHPLLQDPSELFRGLEEFRQHLGGQLTITLLRGIGQPIDVHEVDHRSMESAIEYVIQYEQSRVTD